jgi:8-oxo-dGTP pyrophosphatase MutT (NUDIX family)
MVKISFGEHYLYISSDVNMCNVHALNKKKAVTYAYTNSLKLRDIITQIPKFEIKNHILYHPHPEEVLNELYKMYTKIEASGGLVVNERNQVLFIYRNNCWDLPKGKSEINEANELTAIREVEEECGIKITSLKKHLIDTYHTYILNKKTVLKLNHWFLMYADSNQILKPQLEENIQKAEWKDISEIPELLKNSFSSIRDVWKEYQKQDGFS